MATSLRTESTCRGWGGWGTRSEPAQSSRPALWTLVSRSDLGPVSAPSCPPPVPLACVLHDSWLFPLDEVTAHSALTCPTLFLNSSTFDNIWPSEGVKVQKSFVEAAKESGGDVYVMHVVGTKHASFADFPVLFSDVMMVVLVLVLLQLELTSCHVKNVGAIGPTDPKKAMRAAHVRNAHELFSCGECPLRGQRQACDESFFTFYLQAADDRFGNEVMATQGAAEKKDKSSWA
eukprot:765309-Hanusia_phi.AAC.10